MILSPCTDYGVLALSPSFSGPYIFSIFSFTLTLQSNDDNDGDNEYNNNDGDDKYDKNDNDNNNLSNNNNLLYSNSCHK